MIEDALKLLPYSLKQDPVLVAMFEAAVIQLQEAYDEAEALSNLVDVDKIPARLLDLIAYERHVDFYDSNLSIEQKRELVKKSISWHRKKGTRWAVEQILHIFFKDVDLYEWFEYDGTPYRFSVEVSVKENSRESYQKVIKMIESTKNKRSLLEYFAWILGKATLLLKNDSYNYPVFYKECGTFNGEKNFSQHELSAINVDNDSYNFAVEYPISEKFVTTIEGESTDITNDTYTYPKRFYAAGELETLTKQISQLTATSNIQQDCYNYIKSFLVCGEFYAEAE